LITSFQDATGKNSAIGYWRLAIGDH